MKTVLLTTEIQIDQLCYIEQSCDNIKWDCLHARSPRGHTGSRSLSPSSLPHVWVHVAIRKLCSFSVHSWFKMLHELAI
jgi:hypothetical protein